jgi:hypothetical protein
VPLEHAAAKPTPAEAPVVVERFHQLGLGFALQPLELGFGQPGVAERLHEKLREALE